MRKRNLSGMLLSATALLLMAVGIGFVVISKHQVGLSSKPVSTHSKFGLVTVSLLFASVLRSMIRPCLFSDTTRYMSGWISRILATTLFILSYYTAYVIQSMCIYITQGHLIINHTNIQVLGCKRTLLGTCLDRSCLDFICRSYRLLTLDRVIHNDCACCDTRSRVMSE